MTESTVVAGTRSPVSPIVFSLWLFISIFAYVYFCLDYTWIRRAHWFLNEGEAHFDVAIIDPIDRLLFSIWICCVLVATVFFGLSLSLVSAKYKSIMSSVYGHPEDLSTTSTMPSLRAPRLINKGAPQRRQTKRSLPASSSSSCSATAQQHIKEERSVWCSVASDYTFVLTIALLYGIATYAWCQWCYQSKQGLHYRFVSQYFATSHAFAKTSSGFVSSIFILCYLDPFNCRSVIAIAPPPTYPGHGLLGLFALSGLGGLGGVGGVSIAIFTDLYHLIVQGKQTVSGLLLIVLFAIVFWVCTSLRLRSRTILGVLITCVLICPLFECGIKLFFHLDMQSMDFWSLSTQDFVDIVFPTCFLSFGILYWCMARLPSSSWSFHRGHHKQAQIQEFAFSAGLSSSSFSHSCYPASPVISSKNKRSGRTAAFGWLTAPALSCSSFFSSVFSIRPVTLKEANAMGVFVPLFLFALGILNKDPVLFYQTTFLIFVIITTMVLGGCAVTELFARSQFLGPKCQPNQTAPPLYSQEIMETTRAMFVVACLAAWPFTKYRNGEETGLKWTVEECNHTFWSYSVQAFFSMLAVDAYNYWKHRFLHHRLLFAFHKSHHSFHDPSAFAGFAIHPVEAVLTFWEVLLFSFPTCALWIPFHGWYVVALVVLNFYLHCGFKCALIENTLPWLTINTSTFHNAHHEKTHTHFGELLYLWDLICATDGCRKPLWGTHTITEYRRSYRLKLESTQPRAEFHSKQEDCHGITGVGQVGLKKPAPNDGSGSQHRAKLGT